MTSVKEIFVEARERTGDDRKSFLDQACAGDADLRAEVEAYLAAEDEAEGFLAQPESSRSVPPTGLPLREGPGSHIGRYKLLQLIGEGGMGSVFMAEQQSPVRRMVAMKIVKRGMDTRQVIARFEAERQALAMMDHPNIARVLDAGETETGRPYFVMELVKGVPITQYCDLNKLSTAQRLDLFVAVCRAVQHAHQKGVIHRDIKPNNILITLHDGTPVPKLIDFGIAKATQSRLTEKTLFTEFRELIGTPAYMSPEQAEMSGLGVDTRSDIYSLGVLLYELLTGTTPFDAQELRSASYAQVQRMIREVDPPSPSVRLTALGESLSAVAASHGADPRKLTLQVRGELDWIVMKAMEKDRTRRYESAGELARDVGRHLSNEPVEAFPPSTLYRLHKFVSRNLPMVSAAAAVVIVAVLAGVVYVHGIRNEQRKTEAALLLARSQRIEADRRRIEAEQASAREEAAVAQANDQMVRSAVLQARGGRTSFLPGRRFDGLAALAAVARVCFLSAGSTSSRGSTSSPQASSPQAGSGQASVSVRSQAAGCLALADLRVLKQWPGLGADGICFNHACNLFATSDTDGSPAARGEGFYSGLASRWGPAGNCSFRQQDLSVEHDTNRSSCSPADPGWSHQ